MDSDGIKNEDNVDANGDGSDDAGKTDTDVSFSVQGVLEMMNINVEAAKKAEALIKKHIIAMYGVAGKKVTIDSILAPVARRLLPTSSTSASSCHLGADTEIKYTVTGFADKKQLMKPK